jgi:hypothetical protein
MHSRSFFKSLIVLFLLLAVLTVPALAAGPGTFPGIIDLPDGHRPEGIATGRGASFYAGSLADGSVFGGDLRTGEGALVVPPQAGRIAVGMDVDLRSNALFVAGGAAGEGYVYDAGSGTELGVYTFTSDPSFVNDVIVTREAAYFTDSFRPFLYKVPLGPAGRLPGQSAVEEIPLGGDYVQAPGFSTNGIEASANGDWLVIVNSGLGLLYRVDPSTGVADEIDLGGASVSSGDGLLLQGHTLYVVRNFLNQIAVVELAPDLLSGTVAELITNPNFDIPTTVAGFGNSLYAVNARFSTPPLPDTEYQIVKVSR